MLQRVVVQKQHLLLFYFVSDTKSFDLSSGRLFKKFNMVNMKS